MNEKILPVIALIGRTNVGKSTLFNRLIKKKDALIEKIPGTTRDRKYGIVKWKKNKFIIIDTVGIDNFNIEKPLSTEINQSFIAINEADIVLFIVNVNSKILAQDYLISKYLRNQKKISFLLMNKFDVINNYRNNYEFYSLKIKRNFFINSLHGTGIKKVLQEIIFVLTQNIYQKQQNSTKETNINDRMYVQKKSVLINDSFPSIKIAIIGRPNVGKSTLVNCILGQDRMTVHSIPGTTRDSISSSLVFDTKQYVLIDTAGIRKKNKIMETIEKNSILQTLKSIKIANIVLLVTDSKNFLLNQDLTLLNIVFSIGKSLIIVINKLDDLSKKEQKYIKENIICNFKFIDFVKIHFVSALYNIGISDLLLSIDNIYKCSTKQISTSLLTKIMHTAINKCRPPLINGYRAKIKYAHIGGYHPLTIVIYGSKLKQLSDCYKRYLVNYFRNSFKILGTPINIQCNETKNPFILK